MSDLVELKPCPFCGGSASMVRGGPGNFFVQCEECRSAGDDGSKEYGIAAWNRRAPDPELSRLSALVAEWQKAAEPFVAVAQNDIGECEADADFFRPIGIKYARVKLLTVGDFRRLSQLKDTTNADK